MAVDEAGPSGPDAVAPFVPEPIGGRGAGDGRAPGPAGAGVVPPDGADAAEVDSPGAVLRPAPSGAVPRRSLAGAVVRRPGWGHLLLDRLTG